MIPAVQRVWSQLASSFQKPGGKAGVLSGEASSPNSLRRWQQAIIPSNVHASAHEGGVALLNIHTGRVYLCNETGSQVWSAIAAHQDPDSFTCQFSREHDIPLEVARQQIRAFLSEMEASGIITPRPEHAQSA